MGNFAENLNLGNRFRPPLQRTACIYDLPTGTMKCMIYTFLETLLTTANQSLGERINT